MTTASTPIVSCVVCGRPAPDGPGTWRHDCDTELRRRVYRTLDYLDELQHATLDANATLIVAAVYKSLTTPMAVPPPGGTGVVISGEPTSRGVNVSIDPPREWPAGTVAPSDATAAELALHMGLYGSVLTSTSEVWCPCWETPEPPRPWIYPDDEHADVCHDSLAAVRAATARYPSNDKDAERASE